MNDQNSDTIKRVMRYDSASQTVLWNPRTIEDFPTGKNDRTRAYALTSFNDAYANKPVTWQHTKSGCWVKTRGRVFTLSDVAKALRIPARTADKIKTQAKGNVMSKTEDKKNRTVRNRVELDPEGNPIWRVKTPDNAPRTPREKIEAFNAQWAGKPLPLRRAEDGTTYYKVAFFRVTPDELKKLLTET